MDLDLFSSKKKQNKNDQRQKQNTGRKKTKLMRSSLVRCSRMFLLGERDVRRALDLKDCLDVNRKALIALWNDTAYVPDRLGMPYPTNPNIPTEIIHSEDSSGTSSPSDWTLIKPAAYYAPESKDNISMGMKVVSVRANNPSNGLPLVPATILLLDAASGIVAATISGTHITVARTSAGPALAVQAFKPDVQNLVVFGAGAQAECHIKMMELAIQRQIEKITIINRSKNRADALKDKILAEREEQNGHDKSRVDVILLSQSDDVETALSSADVVAATTNTKTPLWENGSILKKGCLITSIGSYTPDMQEIPPSAVDRSHVVIDTKGAMSVGDLKHLGTYETTNHLVTLAGEAFEVPDTIGSSTDYIFYKAVGTAIQDVLTTKMAVEKAKELNIGQEIDMT